MTGATAARPRGWHLLLALLPTVGVELAAGLRGLRGWPRPQRGAGGGASAGALECDPGGAAPTAQLLDIAAPLQGACRSWRKQAASSRLLEVGLRGRYAEFWALQDLRPTSEGFVRGAAPLGQQGARLRWSAAAGKLLGGTPLKVVTLGGSMTFGEEATRAWPARLEELFSELGYGVHVTNRAVPGTSSAYAVANFAALRADLEAADVVVVEYGINDLVGHPDFRQDEGQLGVLRSYRQLLLMLLGLPRRPAVVGLELFVTDDSTESGTVSCTRNITEHLHWRVNQELQLPTLSYTEAVCGLGRTFWVATPDHDMPGNADMVDVGFPWHPGDMTHDVVARLVLWGFAQEMDGVCARGVAGGEHLRSQDLDPWVQCLARPTTHLTSTMGGAAALVPVEKDTSVWSFGEDVPGKPGWLAAAHGTPGDIAFPVRTAEGLLQVEFLGTYEHIGSMTCWLDAGEPSQGNSCRLDGLWRERVSMSRFAHMRTGLPPGQHILRCRSDGAKFKLLGLAAC